MKVVFISDSHTLHDRLTLPNGDLLIHGGDFCGQGSLREAQAFFAWLELQPHPYKIVIAGNHDRCAEDSPQEFRALIPPSVIYLENDGVEIEGISIWGSPVTPWFYDFAFNRQRGPDIDRAWQRIPEELHVLVTHGPPQGVLDLTTRQVEAGCADLRRRVVDTRPRFHLFGHIHEGYGAARLGTTICYNGSVVDERYNLCNAPIEFEL